MWCVCVFLILKFSCEKPCVADRLLDLNKNNQKGIQSLCRPWPVAPWLERRPDTPRLRVPSPVMVMHTQEATNE